MRPNRARTRRLAAPTVLGGVFVLLLWVGPTVLARSPEGPVGDLDSSCRASVRSTISQRWVGVGERVAVMTRIGLSCPAQRRPYHVVFVVDAAAVRQSSYEGGLADDVRGLAEPLALEHNRHVRAGVVGYGATAETLCSPVNEPGIFLDCLHLAAAPAPERLTGSGGLAAGLRQAAKALLMARSLSTDRPSDHPLREGIVALERPAACAAGEPCEPNRPECASARLEARDVVGSGMDLDVVCLAEDCSASCIADVADRAHAAYAWDAMTRRQSTLAWQSELRVAEFALSEPLHPTLLVDPASIDYTAGQYSSGEHGITWHVTTRHRAAEPILLSYAVTTTVPGTYNVRLPDAGGILVDTDGLAAPFGVPGHVIEVVAERLTHLHLPWACKPVPPPPPSKPLRDP